MSEQNQNGSQHQHDHHSRTTAKDIQVQPYGFNAGCILRRDVPGLKKDVADYIGNGRPWCLP